MKHGLLPLQPDDLLAVAAIETAVGQPWRTADFAASLAGGQPCLGWWRHGELIGYVLLQRASDDVEIVNLAISPAWQRQGQGRLLLQAVFAHAVQLGGRRLLLEVRAGNLPAQRLYARQGFVGVGRRKDYYASALGREDALLLDRPLP